MFVLLDYVIIIIFSATAPNYTILIFTIHCLTVDIKHIFIFFYQSSFRDKFVDVDKDIGALIHETCGDEGFYGFRPSPRFPDGKLGIFQVKYHFAAKATVTLISASTIMLRDWAKAHSDIRIDLNFPGIGYGGLSVGAVEPFVKMLPDNVHVWRFPTSEGYTPTEEDRQEGIRECWDFADGMP